MTFPDFLKRDTEIIIPTGGTFTPSGLTAHWFAGMTFEFGVEADSALLVEPLAEVGVSIVERQSEKQADLRFRESSGWVWFRGRSYDMIIKAIEVLDVRNRFRPDELQKPSQHWQWEAPKATLLNVAVENRESFNDPVVYSAEVLTLGSAKARHELHLISLPAAVAAYARDVKGYDVPEYDLSELLDLGRDTAATDVFQIELVGSYVDDNEAIPAYRKYQSADGGWQASIMGQRRAELWAALDEPDPARYKPYKGTGKRPGKFETQAPKLIACLDIIYKEWSGPVWGRVLGIPCPRVDNFYKVRDDIKRRTIPALVEMFPDEATAQAAAEEGGAAPSKGRVSGKAIPAVYANHPKLWEAAIAQFKAKGITGPPPVIRKAISETPDFQGIAPDEVLPWV